MINPEAAKRNSLALEQDVADQPRVNWTLASPTNPGDAATKPGDRHGSFDQLLQVCLGTMNHEMRLPLDVMLQTIDQLTAAGAGSLTDEQLEALAMLRQQVQTLEHMIDGLIYISAVSCKT
jgi:signal transduction histidine kinase